MVGGLADLWERGVRGSGIKTLEAQSELDGRVCVIAVRLRSIELGSNFGLDSSDLQYL
jgi:hypothetical protein